MISSSVKVTAAMGALNAAAIPAATPTAAMRRWLWPRQPMRREAKKLEMAAQIARLGPLAPRKRRRFQFGNDAKRRICRRIPQTAHNLHVTRRPL